MPTLEQLSIQIAADSQTAYSQISNLSSSLSLLIPKLERLEKINLSNFGNIASEMHNLSLYAGDLQSALNKIDFSNLAGSSKTSLDGIITKQSVKIIEDYGIKGRKAFNEIKTSLTNVYSSFSAWKTLFESDTSMAGWSEKIAAAEYDLEAATKTLQNQISEYYAAGTRAAETGYESLLQTVKSLNSSALAGGMKISVGSVANELGEDWNRIRKTLGAAFTSQSGLGTMGFDSWVESLTQSERALLDTSSSLDVTVKDLAAKLKTARGQLNDITLGAGVDTSTVIDTGELNQSINYAIKEIDEYKASLDSIGNKKVDFGLEYENSELGNLEQAITKVTKAVDKKTAAFEKEGTKVSSVTTSEVGKMSSLQTAVSAAAQKVSTISEATANVGAGSAGLSNLTSSLEGVRELTTQLNSMTALNFDVSGITNLANAIGKLGKSSVTQATANITALIPALRKFSNVASSMSFASADLAGLSQLTASISQLGGTNATAAATTNIAALGNALSQLMTTLSQAPAVSQNLISMTNALANLATSLGTVNTTTAVTNNRFNNLTGTTAKTRKGLTSLAAAFGRLYASMFLVFRLVNLLKEAVEISSDLTEVQNIVDTTFGDMAYKVEEFAETSIESFGISELSLKTYASRFQAMGVAMGITASQVESANSFLAEQTDGYVEMSDSLADVSLNLTKLAADMASFYNMDSEDVAEDLEAIFTGQVKPLRQYGLDLTQATLQEWALKNGLDADIDSMSQAEKTMLRYQYVMANTSSSWNDFTDTAYTWANQVKILKQQLQQWGSVVGTSIINALKPLVNALNSVMAKVITFTETVTEALGSIFGWKYESDASGVTDDWTEDLEDAEDSSDEVSDNLSDAADSVSDMQDGLRSFDELNLIDLGDDSDSSSSSSDDDDDSSSSSSSVSGAIVEAESIFDYYKSTIDDLEELGEYISSALTSAMLNIDWDSIYEKARNFGTGLADFLNGLISPELFSAVGQTIAGALNTALEFLNAFGTTFDWSDFGLSIAAGINKFFSTFNFKLLAETLNTWVDGIRETIVTAINNISWKGIFDGLSDFLSNLELDTAFVLAAIGVNKFLKALKAGKISPFIVKLGTLAKAVLTGTTVMEALTATFPALASAITTATTAFSALFVMLKNRTAIAAVGTAASTASLGLTTFQSAMISIVAVAAEFVTVKNAFSDLASGSDNLVASVAKITVAITAVSAALALVTGSWTIGIAIAGATAVVAALTGIKDAMDEVQETKVGDAIYSALSEPGGTTISELCQSVVDGVESISESFDTASEYISQFDEASDTIDEVCVEIEKIKTSMDASVLSTEEGVEQLTNCFESLVEAAEDKIEAYQLLMIAAFGEDSVTSNAFEAAGVDVEELKKDVVGFSSEIQTQLEEDLAKYQELSEGDQSDPEIIEQMNALEEEISVLSGAVDDTSVDFQLASDKISGSAISWNDYLNEDDFDLDLLCDDLDEMFSTIDSASDSIEENFEELCRAALETGDTARYEMLSSAMGEAVSYVKEGLAADAATVTDGFQTDMLDKITDLMDSAASEWENMTWWEKLCCGGDFDSYCYTVLEDYKENYVDPTSDYIEGEYEKLGVEGAGWASDSMEEIMDSLFTVNVNGSSYSTSLRSDYEDYLDAAMEGLPSYSAEYGYGIGEAAAEGAESGIEEQSDYEAFMDSGYTMGISMVNGLTSGMDENQDDVSDSAESTWEVIKGAFSGAGEWFGENFASAYGGMTEPFEETDDWAGDTWDTISGWFGSAGEWFGENFAGAYSGMTEQFDSTGTWASERWETIKSGFSTPKTWFGTTFTSSYSAIISAFANAGIWAVGRWSVVKSGFSTAKTWFGTTFTDAYDAIGDAFSDIKTWASGRWKKVKEGFGGTDAIKEWFKDGFQDAYDAICKIFDNLGEYFKGIAEDIMEPIKKLVNGILKGVRWVLKKVGATDAADKIKDWEGVTFAKGSPGIERDTLGIVNDQSGATYKELIVPPSGKAFIPKGRNVMLPLEKGTKILPAAQTKSLMAAQGITHYASGIGDLLGSAWSKFKDFTGDIWDYITNPSKIVEIMLDKYADISSMVSPWTDFAAGAVKTMFSSIVDFITGIFDTAIPTVTYDASKGVEQWRQLSKVALKMCDQYTVANLNRLLMQMETESGGNPYAINNWDSNAAKGTPSKGLMQVIDPTFKAYAMKGYDTNIWDPISNILASIRYTVARYGTLAKGWQGHGYASGIGDFSRLTATDLFPAYAAGGFPEDGLFLANSTELVGGFGSKTAVANNEQIVKGIADGVKKAVAESLAPYLKDIADNTEKSANKDLTITQSAVGKAASNYGKEYYKRTGKQAFAY